MTTSLESLFAEYQRTKSEDVLAEIIARTKPILIHWANTARTYADPDDVYSILLSELWRRIIPPFRQGRGSSAAGWTTMCCRRRVSTILDSAARERRRSGGPLRSLDYRIEQDGKDSGTHGDGDTHEPCGYNLPILEVIRPKVADSHDAQAIDDMWGIVEELASPLELSVARAVAGTNGRPGKILDVSKALGLPYKSCDNALNRLHNKCRGTYNA